MEQKIHLNVIGQKCREIREALGLTQDQVAAKCQVLGLDITRGTLAKIESRVRAVSDHEIPFLAKALDTPLQTLFPAKLRPLKRKPRNPGTGSSGH
jgi:transcriptional regulator with XRE-family HTH domain